MERIGFPEAEFYAKFSEKKIIKKMKYSRSLSGTENYWCGHQQSYNFFPVFANFRTLLDNSGKPKLVDSKRKNQLQLGKNVLFDYLKRKDF